MRFKKPQVRYADTPQLATPYQAAGQVWDDRIGSPRVQAKNWRLMAFGCLTLALMMAGGLVWRSAQSIVTPTSWKWTTRARYAQSARPLRRTGPTMHKRRTTSRVS